MDKTHFHDSVTFENDLIKIFKRTIEDKLPSFLDYCIHTHNAEPIMNVIYVLSVNTFTEKPNKNNKEN